MFEQRLAAWLIAICLVAQLACGGGLPAPPGSDRQPTTSRGGNTSPPRFTPGFNLFSPEQDVQLGRQSAQQIAQQQPLLRDERIVGFVRALGARLAAKAPGEKFPYQFNVVGTRDINAFALPGGFIFVNAGAIAAARNEGELAGVMAHEIMHVALRHGTNQASKAYIARAGIGVLSTIAGGNNPDIQQVVNTVGGAGANVLFLKFGRTAEKQSDLEGARIMAEAGYDPRDMAGFFETLQKRSGGQRTPEFLSDHPDPGNRVQAILGALPSLPVRPNPVRTSNEFEAVKATLTGGSARQSLQRSSSDAGRTGPRDPQTIKPTNRPQPPSTNRQSFQASDGSFALQHPDNWQVSSPDPANIIIAPRAAYAELNRSIVVTHGIFVGALPLGTNNLEAATKRFIETQLSVNPDLQLARNSQSVTISNRPGYATVISGPSPVTGVTEVNVVFTTLLGDGRLLYLITIAPEDELPAYQNTFEAIVASLRAAA